MRILRIKFENLNSLPSGDIDLEHGPLASAGIFAITGPTGAGKSTLLDAITLALYGRAARYDKEPNPENMMSRHTGHCQAEVLFEVPRGRFQARWELRRARGKAEGKLQAAKRTVTEDGSGTVLAEKIDVADRLVEELTGLDYERFRRSVLLAQGEFTRFLKAKPDERAELLESLTGTAIYSQLSELAYREATRREEELAACREALSRVVLLTEEERAQKGTEIERLDVESKALVQRRETVAQRVGQGRQLLERLREETGILQKQAALFEEAAQAAPHLERLKAHQQAQPFLGHLQTLDALERQAVAEAVQYDNTRAATAQARVRLASGFFAVNALAQGLVEQSREGIAKAESELGKLTASLEESANWLDAHAADAALDAVFAELTDRLNHLANARRQSAALAADSAVLDRQRQEGTQRLLALHEELAKAEAGEREAAAHLQKAEAALAALLKGRSAEALLAESAKHEQHRVSLIELRTAMEKRDNAATAAVRLSDEEAQLVEEVEVARQEKVVAEQEAEAQAKLLESARVELELQERIASLEDQRTQLKSGEACPLCGALEHPFVHPEGRPSACLEEARRNLKAAKMASDSTTRESKLASDVMTRTEERLAGVRKQRGDIRWKQTEDHEAFEKLARTVRIYTLEALAEAFDALEKARAAQEKLESEIRKSESHKHALDKALLTQQGGLAQLRQKLAGEVSTLNGLDTRFAALTADVALLQTELAAQSSGLATALEPFGVSVPEPGAEAQTRQLLEKRRKQFSQNAATRVRLESELAQLRFRLEALKRDRDSLCKQAQQLSGSQSADGIVNTAPDVDLAAWFQTDWTTLEAAGTALEQLRSRVTETTATAEAGRKNLEGVQQAVAVQSAALQSLLAGSGFSDAAGLRAARLADAEAAKLAALQNDLEARAQALAGQETHVREQVRALREEATAPEGDALAALEAEGKTLEEATATAAEARATLRNDLLRDDQTRQSQAEQLAQWEEGRTRLAVWERLRRLIGSANGAVFQQFAQGISLDLLVRHANRHLNRFSDRYRLRRVDGGELTLEIVDRHQADATRPMQSLSGGESFLASLALALGLSDLAGRNVRIDSLFIDEGFGSLDSATLDLAVGALDALRLANKTVGVISHVELLKERIPVQIRVEKRTGGVSVLLLPETA